MNTKSNRVYPIGFTSVDNRVFYMQDRLSPNAFSILIRIYRMSNGYDSKPKSLSNTYFQTACNVSKNTVTRAVKELETLGVINVQRRARANSLYSINMETVDNLYKIVVDDSHTDIGLKPSDVPTVSSNRVTTKQNPLKQNSIKQNTINIPFDDFWSLYDYKRGKLSDIKTKWESLSDEERQLTIDNLPTYILSTPNKQYRKYPMTYLEQEVWNDEVIVPTDTLSGNEKSTYNRSNNSSDALTTETGYNSLESTTDASNKGDKYYKIFQEHSKRASASHPSKENNTAFSASFKEFSDEVITDSDKPHWYDLAKQGRIKDVVNPDAIDSDSSFSKSVDDFFARFGSKGNMKYA